MVGADGSRLTVDEERFTIDEERKYAAPARNIPIVMVEEQRREELVENSNSDDQHQNGHGNEESKNALASAIDSYRASDRSNNNAAVIETSSFEEKPVCECQFCHNMILLEDLI